MEHMGKEKLGWSWWQAVPLIIMCSVPSCKKHFSDKERSRWKTRRHASLSLIALL